MKVQPQLIICPPDLREAVEFMLQDLADSGLVVGLIPAPERTYSDWQCVRAVWGRNPGWYRELLAMFPRRRRNRASRYTDSTVKRGHVVNVLRRMLDGGTTSFLAEPLLSFAREIKRSEAESVAYMPVAGADATGRAACGF